MTLPNSQPREHESRGREPQAGASHTGNPGVAAQPDTEPGRSRSPAALPRVLGVTEDRIVRTVLERVLAPWADEVLLVPAAGAEAASQLTSGDGPELLILDHAPPAIDGLTLARQVRARSGDKSGPRIILLIEEEELPKAVGSCRGLAVDLVAKPARTAALLEAIEKRVKPSRQDLRPTVGHPRLPPPADIPDLRGMRVLLAEDNAVNQALVVDFLRPTGCEVTIAENGAEAVELAANQAFDLALMDLYMPVLGGCEAAQRIRAIEGGKEPGRNASRPDGIPDGYRLPIVVLSAATGQEQRRSMLAAGMDDCLGKPFGAGELYALLAARRPVADGAPSTLPDRADPPLLDERTMPGLCPLLDTGPAIARMGGNRKLYLDTLRAFADGQASVLQAIHEAWTQGDSAAAQRMAHTLKGLAGTIGATTLEPLARELEEALGKRQEERIDSLLGRLAAPLADLLRAVGQLGPRIAPSVSAPVPAGCLQDRVPLLARLADLLRDDDAAASDALEAVERAGVPVALRLTLAIVRHWVEVYEYDNALSELRSGVRSLGVDWGQQYHG